MHDYYEWLDDAERRLPNKNKIVWKEAFPQYTTKVPRGSALLEYSEKWALYEGVEGFTKYLFLRHEFAYEPVKVGKKEELYLPIMNGSGVRLIRVTRIHDGEEIIVGGSTYAPRNVVLATNNLGYFYYFTQDELGVEKVNKELNHKPGPKYVIDIRWRTFGGGIRLDGIEEQNEIAKALFHKKP